MAYVVARGKKHGIDIWTSADDLHGEFRVMINGVKKSPFQDELDMELDEQYPMGGTYIPDRNSFLNAYNVFRYHFFDEEPEIEIDGDIGTIPKESGDKGYIY